MCGQEHPLGESSRAQPACAAGLDSGEENEDTVQGLEENRVQRRPQGGTGSPSRGQSLWHLCALRETCLVFLSLYLLFKEAEQQPCRLCVGSPIGVSPNSQPPGQGQGTQPRGSRRLCLQKQAEFQ